MGERSVRVAFTRRTEREGLSASLAISLITVALVGGLSLLAIAQLGLLCFSIWLLFHAQWISAIATFLVSVVIGRLLSSVVAASEVI
jgi:hypothetical protein